METQVTVTVSIATLITALVPLLVAMFGGAWVLMKAMIFNPMMSLKGEIKETTHEIKKLNDSVTSARGEIMIINQWRVDAERRIGHLENRRN